MSDYRYRVMGHHRDDENAYPVVLESFAYDIHDANARAAFHHRWGYAAWVERQLIVDPPEPPPWQRVS